MPQIKVRGISPEKLCKISVVLLNELSELIDCPRDHFEIEYFQTLAISEGNIEAAYPFVEVAWFDRGLVLQDKAAELITKHIHELGVSNVDIVFTCFEKRNYYENGTHF